MTRSAREVCESKAWYGTEPLATRAALLVSWRGAHQEPYTCPTCGAWHLRTMRDSGVEAPLEKAARENA